LSPWLLAVALLRLSPVNLGSVAGSYAIDGSHALVLTHFHF
jgi:hypothetical protein